MGFERAQTPGSRNSPTSLRRPDRTARRADSPAAALYGMPPITGNQSLQRLLRDRLRSSGRPLDAGTRALMERAFGQDFGHVRVHTDAQADKSATAVKAQGHTVGRELVFARGQYAPETVAGRRLLAHELAHVVQQSGHRATASASEPVLEAEASRAAQDAARGQRATVRSVSPQGRPQFVRRHIDGREFEVGDIHLDALADVDVRVNRVLFPGPDQAHIVVTGDRRLGYEVAHTDPDDPFRWERLREIVDTGQADISAVTFPGEFRVTEVTGVTSRVLRRTLFAVGGAGITLLRRRLFEAIYPGERTFTASPRDDRDTIYYESGAGGRGLLGGNPLAHELFGHLWLGMRGVPFVHPLSVEEAEREAAAHGRPLTATERAGVIATEARLGTLRAEHGIRDPFGRLYTGTVREYIDRYAGAGIGALESPTQRVGERHLETSLERLFNALLAPEGLKELGGGAWEVSGEVGTQWAFVSNNYEVLRYIRERDPFDVERRLSEGVLNLVLEWYDARFTDAQRRVFRSYLGDVSTSMTYRLPRTLSRDLLSALRSR